MFLQSPVQRVSPQGVRYPLGVPFASYRTAVGAALGSWVLGMLTTQDVMSTVVAAVRDLRSLGPPNHCWQKTAVHELLVDVMVSPVAVLFLGQGPDLASCWMRCGTGEGFNSTALCWRGLIGLFLPHVYHFRPMRIDHFAYPCVLLE